MDGAISRGRQHHLLIGTAQVIAIHVNVQEAVIGADFLQLGVGVHQRPPVPQPDVVDRPAILLQRLVGQLLLRRKRLHDDLVQIVRLPRQRDVPLQVWRLQLQLARLDDEAFEQAGQHFAEHE